MPDSSPAGPSTNTNTLTTTTTTTTVHSRGRPYTFTSTQPSTQIYNQPSSPVPVTIVSPPESSNEPSSRTTVTLPPQVNRLRPIGIKRLPSSNFNRPRDGDASPGSASVNVSRSSSLRGRSSSAPQQHATLDVPATSGNIKKQTSRQSLLPTVTEGTPSGQNPGDEPSTSGNTGRRSVGNAARSIFSRRSDHSQERQGPQGSEYESDVVDLLDVLGR